MFSGSQVTTAAMQPRMLRGCSGGGAATCHHQLFWVWQRVTAAGGASGRSDHGGGGVCVCDVCVRACVTRLTSLVQRQRRHGYLLPLPTPLPGTDDLPPTTTHHPHLGHPGFGPGCSPAAVWFSHVCNYPQEGGRGGEWGGDSSSYARIPDWVSTHTHLKIPFLLEHTDARQRCNEHTI